MNFPEHRYFMLGSFAEFLDAGRPLQLEAKFDAKQPFGYLAGYDIYGAKGPLMFNNDSSKKAIEKFLVALVKELGMTVAAKPVCYMSDAKEVKTMQHVGASAFVALEDSGIMLHTITNRPSKFACIDVFSCKVFDPNKIEKYLNKEFQAEKLTMKFIKRGTQYNENS